MPPLINIDVPDIHAASIFYQATLGLTQSRVLGDDVVDDLAAAAERAMRA